ncbi:MAG: hypothetical protein EPN59_10845 [Paraburkholderia sp.]|uniref:hypothetical protein n=1 Tax=Paraburkholderia sp. TaxID=1926495 RepID=UPI0011F800FA|nr:hypothetical protein [Paraburkholderia sp.]TAM29934.1 MAG: hypothetical protein EPN59_10845 [Paraburkholderia sp.]
MREQCGLRVERVEREGKAALLIECGGASTILDGAQAEALVQKLALYRSAMNPSVAPQLSRTHNYHITLQPLWFAEPNLTIDGVVLLLRHGGFGWVGFSFDRAVLKRMRRDLSRATAASRRGLLVEPLATQ